MTSSSWSLEHDMVVRRTGTAPRELVWIHGLGEQSASFDDVVSRLPNFTHVLVDLPGYGRSPWPASSPSLLHVADHLATWLGDRKPRPLLAGHSMGGVLAQFVAERIPVAGVIDIDGNLSRGDCTFSARALQYSPTDFASHGFDTIRDELYKSGIADPALRSYYAAMRMASPHVFHRHALELVELSASETLAARLSALTVPVLFIAGVPGGICARSHELLAKHAIRTISIEDAGHWPFIDQPEAFAKAIGDGLH